MIRAAGSFERLLVDLGYTADHLTTQMAHMLESTGAGVIRFAPAELAEFSAAANAIEIRGARLPESVLVYSEVEARPMN